MRTATFIGLILSLAFMPSLALAYIGPGAGISAIGSLLALLAAVGLSIVGFIWYPIRRLLRRARSKGQIAGE